jgi:hypothetical protein
MHSREIAVGCPLFLTFGAFFLFRKSGPGGCLFALLSGARRSAEISEDECRRPSQGDVPADLQIRVGPSAFSRPKQPTATALVPRTLRVASARRSRAGAHLARVTYGSRLCGAAQRERCTASGTRDPCFVHGGRPKAGDEPTKKGRRRDVRLRSRHSDPRRLAGIVGLGPFHALS